MDEHSNPLTPTYPKRAKQIVKQGRAEWVDENTIRMLAGSPAEMRAKDMPDEINARTEWAESEEHKAMRDTQNIPDTDIEVGDVVVLNSGGAEMTVMQIRDDGLLCKWWSDVKQGYSQDVFPVEVIHKKKSWTLNSIAESNNTSRAKDTTNVAEQLHPLLDELRHLAETAAESDMDTITAHIVALPHVDGDTRLAALRQMAEKALHTRIAVFTSLAQMVTSLSEAASSKKVVTPLPETSDEA